VCEGVCWETLSVEGGTAQHLQPQWPGRWVRRGPACRATGPAAGSTATQPRAEGIRFPGMWLLRANASSRRTAQPLEAIKSAHQHVHGAHSPRVLHGQTPCSSDRDSARGPKTPHMPGSAPTEAQVTQARAPPPCPPTAATPAARRGRPSSPAQGRCGREEHSLTSRRAAPAVKPPPTLKPRRARNIAAVLPAGPAPTTTAF
jgi:hypothetical protein